MEIKTTKMDYYCLLQLKKDEYYNKRDNYFIKSNLDDKLREYDKNFHKDN